MDSGQIRQQATRIELFNFKRVQMRAFHMTWFAFFLAFFGWFGIAPLMGDRARRSGPHGRRRSATR